MRVGLLLSTNRFEDFYGSGLGLSVDEYVHEYRNDWSWDWCRMLRDEGVDPVLYIASTTATGLRDTGEGVGLRFLPLGGIARPWIVTPHLSRTPVGRYVAQLANAAAFVRPLRASLAADGIDVLLVQEYLTARFDLLVHALEVPIVAVDQGLPDRREIKALKRRSLARARGVITQTEREATKVCHLGGNARRIPNAVDTELFSPAPEHNGRVRILAVGRLHDAQKRMSDLLRALAELPPEWQLEIAGSGPDHAMLGDLAGRLGLSDRVSLLGFVGSKVQLRDLYRRATVFAIPSAYEGLPMTLLEAMSCGTPVVGSDIAAIAEVVEPRTGRLVPVSDPARLAEALRDVVAGRDELGAGARRAVLER
jgi:glycosyltransferase involved in cell wall biosynthesis